jgi:hypothetical protein
MKAMLVTLLIVLGACGTQSQSDRVAIALESGCPSQAMVSGHSDINPQDPEGRHATPFQALKAYLAEVLPSAPSDRFQIASQTSSSVRYELRSENDEQLATVNVRGSKTQGWVATSLEACADLTKSS